MIDANSVPARSGIRPRTTPTNPHTQLDQQPLDRSLRDRLAQRVFALPDVEERPSMISVPGARAMWLRDHVPAGPPDAFMIGREFAHLHPDPDQSAHAALPPEVAQAAIDAGWAELHPVARRGLIPPTTVMIYAPRTGDELEIVFQLILSSYKFAGGQLSSAAEIEV
ncbi:MAG: luciferase family protein [Chloroflexota bacterium]